MLKRPGKGQQKTMTESKSKKVVNYVNFVATNAVSEYNFKLACIS